MDKLITAFAPVFAAGLGIQQLGEILSPLFDKISSDYKKVILGLVSLALGLVLALQFDLHVINALLDVIGPGGPPPCVPPCVPPVKYGTLDAIVTGIIISGGTEGINSILKFMKYKKEDVKTETAIKNSAKTTATAAATVPGPTEAALADINRK